MDKMPQQTIRADHCGSLVRPRALRQARLDRHFGRLTARQLQAIEDECILDVLAMQREAGFKVTTDGEFRRRFWFSALFESMRGLEQSNQGRAIHRELQSADLASNPELEPPYPVVVGKISRDMTRRNITAAEIAFMKQHAGGPFKITIPSAGTLLRYMGDAYQKGLTDRHYRDPEAMFEDVRAHVEAEVTMAADSGAAYIQIDNPGYSRLMAREARAEAREKGGDPDAVLWDEIEADNRRLRAAKRAGNVTGVHICLGTCVGAPQRVLNTRVNYDPEIVAQVFETLEADQFTCEYSIRAGTIDSLKLRPRLGNKVVGLGMVNVLDRRVESVDEIAGQLERAATYIDLANLAVCNNCGFSGASVKSFVDTDIQRRKLEVIVRTAERLWGTA